MRASSAGAVGPVVLCAALFSVLPLPAAWIPVADRRSAGAALRWLPLLGGVLGAAAGGAAIGLHRAGPLVGAVVAVALLAVFTRGLHLDGLADLADGLGSRRPPAEACAIMRRGDVGPFGVTALAVVVLLDVACYAHVVERVPAAEALWLLAGSVASARVAAVLVAGGELRPNSPGGFGALVCGSQTAAARSAIGVATVLSAASLATIVVGRSRDLPVAALAFVVGPLLGYALARHAARRLDGVSGDVFGAAVEISCVASLLVLAAAL